MNEEQQPERVGRSEGRTESEVDEGCEREVGDESLLVNPWSA